MNRNDHRYRYAVQQVRRDPRSRFCFLSGKPIPEGCGDPAHILPVSTHPEWAYRKINIVIADREAHHIFDHGTAEQIARLPRIHNLLHRMKILDEAYYEQFKEKIEQWMHSQNTWA
jgi:hypothetical protein